MNVLIVVATPIEAQQLRDLPARVVVSGVGSTAAALATWHAVTTAAVRPELVISAGIAGAFAESGLQAGDAAVSSAMIQADLGASDGPHFLSLDELGLSVYPETMHGATFPAWDGAAHLASRAGAAHGLMLTLNTATGTADHAAELSRRYPGALAEGMEGAGVAHAAALLGVPAVEIRGISNMVGPRDRATWRIPEALRTTRRVLDCLLESQANQ